MATKKQEVVEIPSFGTGVVPSYIQQDSARGSEQVAAKDMVIPRLEIIQALSPIKQVLGVATEGQLYNSASGELIGESAYFINCFFRAEWLLWYDQDSGGGFGGSYATEQEAKDALDKRLAEPDNEEDRDLWSIVDTPVHYGLRVDPTDLSICQQIAISMAKTKAKVSRKWNSTIQMVGGDRFSRVYRIGTFMDENKDGKEFYNFTVSPAGFPIEAHYQRAIETYEAVKGSLIKADHEVHDAPVNGDDPVSRAPQENARRGEI